MMISEMRRSHPTIQIPQYLAGPHSPPASSDFSPSAFAADYAAALHSDSDLPSDSFRMYEFKVRRCVRGRSHDWTECPFAHPGEKALRRDPRRYHYSGTPCPDFRKGNCKRGDSCEFAHGVFECWLHPARYRTQPCKDGSHCKRRVCFFAHSPDQIRLPTPLSDSPPMSPPSLHSLLGSFRSLQIRNLTPCSTWSGSSIPSRIGAPTCFFDTWNLPLEEEEPMERVESGKNLRAAMYAKLRMENSLDRSEQLYTGPDFAWVSELIK